jgi:rhamnosyltransferase
MNSTSPRASIISLTKNGGELFRQSLEIVFRQKVPFPFEVVVVDSGSTDGTLDVLVQKPTQVEYIAPGGYPPRLPNG